MASTDTDIASFQHPPSCRCTGCSMDRIEAAQQRRAEQGQAEWWAGLAIRLKRERLERQGRSAA